MKRIRHEVSPAFAGDGVLVPGFGMRCHRLLPVTKKYEGKKR